MQPLIEIVSVRNINQNMEKMKKTVLQGRERLIKERKKFPPKDTTRHFIGCNNIITQCTIFAKNMLKMFL